MTPRKKDRIQSPETVTSSAEEDSKILTESGDGSCPKSSVSKASTNSSR